MAALNPNNIPKEYITGAEPLDTTYEGLTWQELIVPTLIAAVVAYTVVR